VKLGSAFGASSRHALNRNPLNAPHGARTFYGELENRAKSMSTFLPVIGGFKFQPDVDGVFRANLDLRGSRVRVRLDINVHGAVTQHLLDSVAGFVTNLASFDQLARDFLSQDFEQNNESSVRLYVEHHLEQLDPDDLWASLGAANSQAFDADLLLSRIYLCRVGLYPDNQNQRALFDYTVGERLTQYVIVVRFDSDGTILSAEMES
jgi:hypothetical protein